MMKKYKNGSLKSYFDYFVLNKIFSIIRLFSIFINFVRASNILCVYHQHQTVGFFMLIFKDTLPYLELKQKIYE